MGHKSSDCMLPKKVRANEANVVEEISKEVSDMDLCVSTWLTQIQDNGGLILVPHIVSGATKTSFSGLTPYDKREKLDMGNVATSKIKGKGTVVLKITSSKKLKLQNVLYVLDIRKNLVSGTLLSVHSFRMVFESQKLVLGRGYVLDDMWKLNAIFVKSKDEAIEKFILYKQEVETQLNKKIKMVRSDRGGEYVEPFGEYCAKHGIIYEVTPPYSPQSNGVTEWKIGL
ncbi:Retrovirus-related Pol polyprotein from transposon TNT 1-94 [Gossypium australe]|uniref:Retrovirus-related Pol polyprotein from transposon TNT 1-94 n=1 Tax=Gossypium australe TaxID=47621 RepID=A0A5B6UYJ0_9ROSI|nr:Retrovirus-related Pol polyprotein from transposon TNT 1-94 [Gossypium australe]